MVVDGILHYSAIVYPMNITHHHSPHKIVHISFLSPLLLLRWARFDRALHRWRRWERATYGSRLCARGRSDLTALLLGDGTTACTLLRLVFLFVATVEELDEERAGEARERHEDEAWDLHRECVRDKGEAREVVHEPFATTEGD